MKNVAVLTEDGAFALFFRPHPREFAIQGKKNANARGSARGGAGRRWNWLMHYFERTETIKGKLEIADVEVQITIPIKKQIIWFELQFTFSTLLSHLIVNYATIIFHKIPDETFNLNLKVTSHIRKEAEVKIHSTK